MDKIKSSTKKILGGVCLFLVLILVKAVSSDFGKEYAHKFLYSENERNDYINAYFRKMKFPIVVDEYTTWVAASASGQYIKYYYVLNDIDEELLDVDIMKGVIHENIKNQKTGLCDILIKKYKYKAKFIFKSQGSNNPPITIDITYKDCQ
ncbi:hypothetical protein E1L25_25940 [Salmonella enterica subsp. enterica serovar Newport]|nr:hypothetical protein [Salmonella enterica subsp. enterica serovar Newport]HBB6667644.1 hypothetical protein [Salmonella enterica]